MRLQLIRNATLLLDYAGHHLLIDPYFAPKHSRSSYTGKSPNPMVELPCPIEQILAGVELVIVSHLHSDHFDPVAQAAVPHHLPLICQPGDETTIREKGFQTVTPLTTPQVWENITLTRTLGHHGTGEVEGIMGKVMGFILQAAGEPTLYWAGDTILCEEVHTAIEQFKPDVVVTHSCGATWANSAGQRELIVMDAVQTVAVSQKVPCVIATHMEALDHATVSRADLRAYADQAGIPPKCLLIPADGDTIERG